MRPAFPAHTGRDRGAALVQRDPGAAARKLERAADADCTAADHGHVRPGSHWRIVGNGARALRACAGRVKPGRMGLQGIAPASARHPWRTIGAWVAVVLAFVAIGALLGGALTTEGKPTNNPQSQRAKDALEPRSRRFERRDHGHCRCPLDRYAVDAPRFAPSSAACRRRARGQRCRERPHAISGRRPVARLEGSPRDDGAVRNARRVELWDRRRRQRRRRADSSSGFAAPSPASARSTTTSTSSPRTTSVG